MTRFVVHLLVDEECPLDGTHFLMIPNPGTDTATGMCPTCQKVYRLDFDLAVLPGQAPLNREEFLSYVEGWLERVNRALVRVRIEPQGSAGGTGGEAS